jgi:hypothetical protein
MVRTYRWKPNLKRERSVVSRGFNHYGIQSKHLVINLQKQLIWYFTFKNHVIVLAFTGRIINNQVSCSWSGKLHFRFVIKIFIKSHLSYICFFFTFLCFVSLSLHVSTLASNTLLQEQRYPCFWWLYIKICYIVNMYSIVRRKEKYCKVK